MAQHTDTQSIEADFVQALIETLAEADVIGCEHGHDEINGGEVETFFGIGSVSSFDGYGILSSNDGLVVEATDADGNRHEFQITVVAR